MIGLYNLKREFKKVFLYVRKIVPIRCVCCGRRAIFDAICEECLKKMEPYTGARCLGCGEVLKGVKNNNYCLKCIVEPKEWEWMRFYGLYEGLLKELIIRLKFNHDFSALRVLEKLLISVYFKEEISFHVHMIVPVPIHSVRLRSRGFNQSVEIARALSKVVKIPLVTDLLIKTRNTLPQVGLSLKQRTKNVKGAFSITRNIMKKNVVIVDDVYTTGSTITECCKALKKAGAEKIGVMVLARGIIY